MFLTPRWIVSHVFVVALVASFVAAGLWQIDRLQLRQEQNEVIEARIETAPVEPDLIAGLDPEDAEFRPVNVTGRFAPERELFVANRSDEGIPGFWAWTVLVTEDGGEVLVNRGFINRSTVVGTDGPESLEETRAVDGLVTIRGLIRRGSVEGRLSSDGSEISRPDAELAAGVLDLESIIDRGLLIELVEQEPGQAGPMPRAVPGPELSEGPHRSYAFQWFTFATLGVVGYGLVLARIHRGDQSRGDVAPDV